MCEYCENEKILVEKDVVNLAMLQWTGCKPEDAYKFEYQICVFIDRGYMRLADKDDCNCLDHGEKIKINFCPFCGKEV